MIMFNSKVHAVLYTKRRDLKTEGRNQGVPIGRDDCV